MVLKGKERKEKVTYVKRVKARSRLIEHSTGKKWEEGKRV